MLVQLYSTGSSEPAYSLQNTVKQCWAFFHKVTMRRKKRIGVVLKYIEKEKCVQYTGVKGLKEINETGLICQKGFKKFSIRMDFGSQVSSHSYYNIKWSLESSGIDRRQADQWCVTASVFEFNSDPILVLIITDFADNSNQSNPPIG